MRTNFKGWANLGSTGIDASVRRQHDTSKVDIVAAVLLTIKPNSLIP
jgi:hypothetical protein